MTSVILGVLLVITLTPCNTVVHAAGKAPVRQINVVYDDSGSMINNHNIPMDTWCQAKYSMEVFAAMLGENDTMSIYMMSDFPAEGDGDAPPHLVLRGTDGAEVNVSAVHDMVTQNGYTPFGAVKKSYLDLTVSNADEKWLIILTDGEFNGVDSSAVSDFFAAKQDDINIIYLGMGADASALPSDAANNIWCEKAETNDQILGKITQICSRVFEMNRLDVDDGNVTFDIPMRELIIFAQGDGVELGGVTGPGGSKINSGKVVNVRYSEEPTPVFYRDFLVDSGLLGIVCTYKESFEAGTYHVDVNNDKTLEVYYKPDVEIMAYLEDSEGVEVPYTDGVRAGTYKLKLAFVKPGTTDKLPDSPLLGDASISAEMSFNGSKDGNVYHSGDNILIQEGSYHIDATAEYLEYNSVTTSMDFGVYSDKELGVEVSASPDYKLTKEGLVGADEPMVVHVTVEGTELTPQQWESFGELQLDMPILSDRRVELRVEKSESIGDYLIYPSIKGDKPSLGDYKGITFQVKSQAMQGKSLWSGEGFGKLVIDDQRSWLDRNLDKVIKAAVAAGILFLLLGYTPLFKKRLPKKLKSSPEVTMKSKIPGKKGGVASGKIEKKLSTKLVPFIPEEGSIRFLPNGVTGAGRLSIKAVKGKKMLITNAAAMASNKKIRINGETIENYKGRHVPPGIEIEYEDNTYKYTCFPTSGKGKVR